MSTFEVISMIVGVVLVVAMVKVSTDSNTLKAHFDKFVSSHHALTTGLFNQNVRGSIGEEMAEDILKNIGFQKDIHYKVKTKFGTVVPDFTLMLPEGLVVNMDSKFNLTNYQRYLEAPMDAREGHKKAFFDDIRSTIRTTASKGYVDCTQGTLDFVLMFIANDQIFNFITREDSSMIGYARSQKVILCSPSSLSAIFQIIKMAVGNLQLSKSAGEILALINEFHQRWNDFDGEIKTMEKELNSFKTAFNKLKGVKSQAFNDTLEKIKFMKPC